MGRMVAAKVSEIPEGGCKRVTLKGRPIAVFNQQGEFFALLDRCPHQGASLCKGARVGVTHSSGPGSYEYSGAGELVRCPWHGWEFSIRTGQSYCNPSKLQVRTFKVSVVVGAELAQDRYIAETFRVSIESNYMVIDI